MSYAIRHHGAYAVRSAIENALRDDESKIDQGLVGALAMVQALDAEMPYNKVVRATILAQEHANV